MKSADYWIKRLELIPHPEGGYYKQTFRASDELESGKALYTSIYFLLGPGDISHFHRLKSDELWYFHAGNSLSIHMIRENGEYEEARLGLNFDNGELPQVAVRKGTIFGSSFNGEEGFALVGCMVSPGFEFEDFELFTQSALLREYPQHDRVIRKLAFESLPD